METPPNLRITLRPERDGSSKDWWGHFNIREEDKQHWLTFLNNPGNWKPDPTGENAIKISLVGFNNNERSDVTTISAYSRVTRPQRPDNRRPFTRSR